MPVFHLNARTPGQIGEALRRRRKLFGWTQEELGKRSGVKQENLSAVENGAAGVRLGTLCKIMAALGLEMAIQERKTAEPDPPR